MKLLPQELITHQLRLRFFNLEASVGSDSKAFIDVFRKMFRRFQVETPSPDTWAQLECALITNPDNPYGCPVIIVGDEVCPVSDPRVLEGYTYEKIVVAIITRIRSHFLIHAGVVSRNGRGIIIAADTMHGKTTLVFELVRRGFKFLSDEMAALGRADHKVYPFPRSLCVRKGTLELYGLHRSTEQAVKWLDKLLLDVEEIAPDSIGVAVPINHIIILQDPDDVRKAAQGDGRQELSVLVDRLDDTVLAGVRQMDDVADVRVEAECGYPLIKLRTSSTTLVLSQIETLCEERQILVLDVCMGARGKPAFKEPARIGAISKSHAAMELLKRFQGGYKSELLQKEFGGDSIRLFMELSGIMSRADCYRLFVGPLNEMAELVCEIAGG